MAQTQCMKKNHQVRNDLKLTQQELADYLQVSRSVINMAERGARSLPGHAFIRLCALETALAKARQPAASTGWGATISHPDLNKDELLTALRNRVTLCSREAEELKRKAVQMSIVYSQLTTLQSALQELQVDPDETIAAKDEKWLAVQRAKVSSRLSSVSLAKQCILQLRMNALLAEAAEAEKTIKRLGSES